MKKIKLYEDKCIGCGACISIASENFQFDDDGISKLVNEEATNEAIEAAECCPVSAIEIVDSCCGDNCSCGDNCQCENDCDCKK